MSGGGEARHPEAEVEAVARALQPFFSAVARGDSVAAVLGAASHAALDAVRRSPQGEDHEAGIAAHSYSGGFYSVPEADYERMVAALSRSPHMFVRLPRPVPGAQHGQAPDLVGRVASWLRRRADKSNSAGYAALMNAAEDFVAEFSDAGEDRP